MAGTGCSTDVAAQLPISDEPSSAGTGGDTPLLHDLGDGLRALVRSQRSANATAGGHGGGAVAAGPPRRSALPHVEAEMQELRAERARMEEELVLLRERLDASEVERDWLERVAEDTGAIGMLRRESELFREAQLRARRAELGPSARDRVAASLTASPRRPAPGSAAPGGDDEPALIGDLSAPASPTAPVSAPVPFDPPCSMRQHDVASAREHLSRLLCEVDDATDDVPPTDPRTRRAPVSQQQQQQQPLTPEGSQAGGSARPAGRAAARPRPSAQHRRRLTNFYQHYDPVKLPDVVPQLERYRGYADAFIESLVKKYGPEPRDATDDVLPLGWRRVETSLGHVFYKSMDGKRQWERPIMAF